MTEDRKHHPATARRMARTYRDLLEICRKHSPTLDGRDPRAIKHALKCIVGAQRGKHALSIARHVGSSMADFERSKRKQMRRDAALARELKGL